MENRLILSLNHWNIWPLSYTRVISLVLLTTHVQALYKIKDLTNGYILFQPHFTGSSVFQGP